MARFCKNCGTPLNDDATFCGKCGAPVGAAPGPSGPSYGGGSFNGPAHTSSNMDKFKLGLIIASAVLILSLFLPYAKVSFWGISQSISLIKAPPDGYILLAAAIVAIVGAVIDNQILPLVGGGIATFLSILEIFNTKSQLGDMVSLGMGFYLSFIASIALVVLGVLALLDAKKHK